MTYKSQLSDKDYEVIHNAEIVFEIAINPLISDALKDVEFTNHDGKDDFTEVIERILRSEIEAEFNHAEVSYNRDTDKNQIWFPDTFNDTQQDVYAYEYLQDWLANFCETFIDETTSRVLDDFEINNDK